MIKRLVKLTFKSEKIEDFKSFIADGKSNIRAYEGCEKLEIWQDINDSRVFFTYSHWISESHLENYRQSELFKDYWANVKKWFDDKPLAWSLGDI